MRTRNSVNERIRSLLAELREGLQGIYRERLKGVYLYGSYARGEADAESDVDVLVVLDRIDHYGAEIDRSSFLVSELSLKYRVSISRVFVSQEDWAQLESPFMSNVREEAVSA